MLKKIRIRWVILAVCLLLVWTTMFVPAAGEWYARNLYPLLALCLSRFSSLFPFSVGDCFIYGSIACVILYPVYARIKGLAWKRIAGRIAEFLGWVYVWFYLGWGLNYFREDFYTRTQTPFRPYVAEDFKAFLSAYTDSLNATFLPVEKVDKSVVAEETVKGYNEIARPFGMMLPPSYIHAKPMLISPLMSGVGVLGYMGPFFNEYNLNPDLLPVQYPFTYAHEMAHVLGIANEAEANLYGYLVCTRSSVPEIRFSGYFGLLTYVLNNAYLVLDEKDFKAWVDTISPQVSSLYNDKQAYWDERYSPFIGRVQDVVYDWFLKGNNIPSGYQNYSEVVALLMAMAPSATTDNE